MAHEIIAMAKQQQIIQDDKEHGTSQQYYLQKFKEETVRLKKVEEVEEVEKIRTMRKRVESTKLHHGKDQEDTGFIPLTLKENDKSNLIKEIEKRWIPPDFTTFKEAINILLDEQHMQREICKRVSEDIEIKLGRKVASKVYAAYEENDPDKNIFFIVVTNKNINIHEIQGFPIKSQYKIMSVSEDKMISREEISRKLLISQEKFQDMGKSLQDERETLLQYPNISKISYSCLKGRNFAEPGNMQFEEKECIVISVFLKGWIPVGFEKFPDKVGNYYTDVREFQGVDIQGDNSEMLSDNMVSKVFEPSFITCTVQGKLKVDGENSTYALTCAHGVLSESNLHELKRHGTPKYIMKEGGNDFFKTSIAPVCEFGTIKEFYHGVKDGAFLDIAIIEPKDALKNVTDEIKTHAADQKGPNRSNPIARHPKTAVLIPDLKQPIFKLSFRENCDDIIYPHSAIVMKYGSTSGLTFGVFVSRVACLEMDKPDFLEIDGVTQPFSKEGDSGALVLKVNPEIVSSKLLKELQVESEWLFPFIDQEESGNGFQENEHFQIIGIVYGSPKDTNITYCTRITPSMSALGKAYYFSP